MDQKHQFLMILVLVLACLEYVRCAYVAGQDDPHFATGCEASHAQVVLQHRILPLIPIAGQVVAAAAPHLIKQGTQFVNNHFHGKPAPTQDGSTAAGSAGAGGSDAVEEPHTDTHHAVQGAPGQPQAQGHGRRNRRRKNQSQGQASRKNQRPQYNGRQQQNHQQPRYSGPYSGYGRRDYYNSQQQWNPYSGYNPQYPYQNPGGGGYGGPPINIFINYPNPNSPPRYKQPQQQGQRHQRTQPQQRNRHGYQRRRYK